MLRNHAIFALAVAALWATPAAALPLTDWTYPDEISVAEAYNTLYGTAYDEDHVEGLDALLADHGAAVASSFTLADLDAIAVLVFDTSATHTLALEVTSGGPAGTIDLFASGPWTPPSRGWITDPTDPGALAAGTIDLAAVLAGAGYTDPASVHFRLRVGGTVLDAGNTVRIEGGRPGEFLLGYNQGGVHGGDGDLNEPLLYANPVPEPGSLLLFGSGFLGLAVFGRRPRT